MKCADPRGPRPVVVLKLSRKFPIGKDDAKISGFVFCIGTGYTGRKFRRNFGGPSWEEDVGGIEGL